MKELENDIVDCKTKYNDAHKSHQQRKVAIDALREGVTAQRNRVEVLQHKISLHDQTEQKMFALEMERNRLSSELSEAHAR